MSRGRRRGRRVGSWLGVGRFEWAGQRMGERGKGKERWLAKSATDWMD